MSSRTRLILQAVPLFLQFALGCVFVYAALPKIQRPYDFLQTVIGYRLVNVKVAVLAAAALPWLELLVGMALLLRLVRPASLVLASGLLGFFVAIQISAIQRGLVVGCGCFSTGPEESLVGPATVFRTTLLLAAAVGALLLHRVTAPPAAVAASPPEVSKSTRVPI